jgi:hypothetical protein
MRARGRQAMGEATASLVAFFGILTMNDNQNLHVQSRGRSSSRVLAPPGGVCSITLGVAPPPKVARQVEGENI